eukprot:CAMPEP_0178688562 /NCGR_PEP_ID=MMETSP0699-20121125/5060_1 /TAXON_ID=265572 /ORGANISM="Extubocellulus spinifer, Strain CCMP396" /LENGTH=198 /DNA_ID=CAMNT_0020333545 /DNA_START=159 /DNA_END=755 /DNA_ORIENTATION=-
MTSIQGVKLLLFALGVVAAWWAVVFAAFLCCLVKKKSICTLSGIQCCSKEECKLFSKKYLYALFSYTTFCIFLCLTVVIGFDLVGEKQEGNQEGNQEANAWTRIETVFIILVACLTVFDVYLLNKAAIFDAIGRIDVLEKTIGRYNIVQNRSIAALFAFVNDHGDEEFQIGNVDDDLAEKMRRFREFLVLYSIWEQRQ